MNFNSICVFDFETGSADPYTTQPIQIAAAIIDPRNFNTKDTFESLMKPLDEDALEDKALEINGKTKAELKKAPHPKTVWKSFVRWVNKYNKNGNKWNAPIPAGHNIVNFDMVIARRLCKQYNIKTLFHPSVRIDTLQMCFTWFEGQKEPSKLGMDYLRNYFGMPTEGAHDAGVDVKQTAAIMVRFLELQRLLQEKYNIKFEGAFGG